VATYVTSFVCTESTIPNRWVRMHARTFAMVAIANPPCACSLVLNSPASSPYTNLVPSFVAIQSARCNDSKHPISVLSPAGRSDLLCIRKRVASPRCGKESALLH